MCSGPSVFNQYARPSGGSVGLPGQQQQQQQQPTGYAAAAAAAAQLIAAHQAPYNVRVSPPQPPTGVVNPFAAGRGGQNSAGASQAAPETSGCQPVHTTWFRQNSDVTPRTQSCPQAHLLPFSAHSQCLNVWHAAPSFGGAFDPFASPVSLAPIGTGGLAPFAAGGAGFGGLGAFGGGAGGLPGSLSLGSPGLGRTPTGSSLGSSLLGGPVASGSGAPDLAALLAAAAAAAGGASPPAALDPQQALYQQLLVRGFGYQLLGTGQDPCWHVRPVWWRRQLASRPVQAAEQAVTAQSRGGFVSKDAQPAPAMVDSMSIGAVWRHSQLVIGQAVARDMQQSSWYIEKDSTLNRGSR